MILVAEGSRSQMFGTAYSIMYNVCLDSHAVAKNVRCTVLDHGRSLSIKKSFTCTL